MRLLLFHHLLQESNASFTVNKPRQSRIQCQASPQSESPNGGEHKVAPQPGLQGLRRSDKQLLFLCCCINPSFPQLKEQSQ